MTSTEVLVLLATVLLSGGLLWFFFGSRPQAQRADVTDEVQRLSVVLRGGYTPQHFEATAGLPPQPHRPSPYVPSADAGPGPRSDSHARHVQAPRRYSR